VALPAAARLERIALGVTASRASPESWPAAAPRRTTSDTRSGPTTEAPPMMTPLGGRHPAPPERSAAPSMTSARFVFARRPAGARKPALGAPAITSGWDTPKLTWREGSGRTCGRLQLLWPIKEALDSQGCLCGERECDGDARSLSRHAVDRDRAAERLDSVLETDEAGALAERRPCRRRRREPRASGSRRPSSHRCV
jgi:hypothetical protein